MSLDLETALLPRFKEQSGHVGFYFRNLATGQTFGYQENEAFLAASVIKLPVFMCIEKWCSEGKASMDEKIRVKNEDKVPICGALTLFTDEPLVDVRTLCRLMISISDNTATNVLINRYGIENFQKEFLEIGLKNTRLNRVMFDEEAAQRGLQNYIVPAEIGMLLEKIYDRSFVNAAVSEEINEVLCLQQINHKIPGRIDDEVEIAHKTGEDDDLSNDVGIVYAKQPFILCFAGHDTCVGDFEDLIRHASDEIFLACNK